MCNYPLICSDQKQGSNRGIAHFVIHPAWSLKVYVHAALWRLEHKSLPEVSLLNPQMRGGSVANSSNIWDFVKRLRQWQPVKAHTQRLTPGILQRSLHVLGMCELVCGTAGTDGGHICQFTRTGPYMSTADLPTVSRDNNKLTMHCHLALELLQTPSTEVSIY